MIDNSRVFIFKQALPFPFQSSRVHDKTKNKKPKTKTKNNNKQTQHQFIFRWWTGKLSSGRGRDFQHVNVTNAIIHLGYSQLSQSK
ncbi:hypothetical protein PNOK_0257700 [Pyrrhoderma noxium]|uniref:Uncharacterized protein n=1 Tax=Pyrrhoderma noxium TaxID=2282107 RepID=A0A286USR1_9AGAM|nr:hypothetical protein PNOK_0257700 [Pyrrhoderma noxium]